MKVEEQLRDEKALLLKEKQILMERQTGACVLRTAATRLHC